MPYDDEFYARYADYLGEPSVRRAHDWAFSIATSNPNFKQVIDLGCGQCQEFTQTRPNYYVGFDLNPGELATALTLPLDYRSIDWADPQTRFICRSATAFVSLFSTEITAPVAENYDFYEGLFAQLPNLQAGLVSGFYYADERQYNNPVREAGDILSYQTLEAPEAVLSHVFREFRIVMPVPSKMFGPVVWEVWKFFSRR